MRALVTGATGFVGSHVARALVAQGVAVRCLVRAGSRRDALADLPVETAVGDLLDRASLDAAVAGCEWVFHCAADYRLGARPEEAAAMRATNVGGTESLLAAAAEAGARRVVHTSSVGTLGHHADGAPADEATPVAIDDMIGSYKRSKFEAERAAEAWAARGLPVVIVNPSTPVGEGDWKPTPTGQMIVDFLSGGYPAYVDTGLNLIDVRDVAAGHLLAAERGKVGERFILGCRNMSLKEILDALSVISGVPAPSLRVPHWLPLAAAYVEEGLARLGSRPARFSREAVRMSRHRMFFDAGKAVRELGLPQTPVEEALGRAVAWFVARGYVKGRG